MVSPGSEMTDADLAHMLGWKPAVFTCKEGTLSSVIRKIADEAARREREACAKVCEQAAFVAELSKAAVDENGSPFYDQKALDCVSGALSQCAYDIRGRSEA